MNAPERAPAMPDLLARLPVPLRRPFKAGLDRAVARHVDAGGARLDCRVLSGAEWGGPFARLATAPATELPAMLVTTLHADLFASDWLRHYAPARPPSPAPLHPACAAAGFDDERGVFQSFAAIPFVFLIDEKRLAGRRAPRVWEDLLDPIWEDEIVFGGWRPNEESAWREFNAYLLLNLYLSHGGDGLAAFAANVRHLQHNVRTATQAGSNSRQSGAIAILPWMQAEMCPRRERTRVLWPEDGALVMPISWLTRRDAEAKVAPLVAHLVGAEAGAMLARNAYPPTRLSAGAANAFPPDARLRWPGWRYFHDGGMAADSARAAEIFFAVWYARHQPAREALCGS